MNIRPEISDLATPISELRPHPRNVRQGDIGAIAESLNKHGQYRPIVVQKSTGNVLAGNHTLMAARSLGWSSIAATFVDCDDEQALRILLVDNRANDLALYDDRALSELLQDLASTATGLDGSLFSGDDLDDLLFRLDGAIGTVADKITPAEGLDAYIANDTRTLMLPYSFDDYNEISECLTALRKHYDAEDNSALIMSLVKEQYETVISN